MNEALFEFVGRIDAVVGEAVLVTVFAGELNGEERLGLDIEEFGREKAIAGRRVALHQFGGHYEVELLAEGDGRADG